MPTEGDRSAPGRRTGEIADRLAELRTFFSSAVRHPRVMGAAAPTSRTVADTIAQVIPTTGAPVVVELGPGTGTLSKGIHHRLPSGSRHVGIELGEELVEHLRTHLPWLEAIQGDAADLTTLIDAELVGRVDAVVSSIPWSLIDDSAQRNILDQVTRTLSPNGVFTALTYLHATRNSGARRFHRNLVTTFDEVLTHTTWRNFPPILHYFCRRPL